MPKTIPEINQKIRNRSVRVVTADEMTRIVGALGAERAAAEVDVVSTGTFGAMCSSGVWLNFGHSEPPIKMTRVWINDVEAYAGVAAVDAYLGVTQASEPLGMEYGGAHVIEDLLLGKPVVLRAVSYGSDCYPLKELVTEITLANLNQAIMSNPRNAYQRYNAAGNSSARVLHTYMGKLLPGCGNVNFSGAGELSPLINDPDFATIGIGTRIFLGGGIGYVTGSGTQHNPDAQFATLMVQGDLKQMSAEFLKAAVFQGYGSSMYVGIGIPIPVLDAAIARKTAIADRDIETNVMDYSVFSRSRFRNIHGDGFVSFFLNGFFYCRKPGRDQDAAVDPERIGGIGFFVHDRDNLKLSQLRMVDELPGGQHMIVLEIGDAGFQMQDMAQRHQHGRIAVRLQNSGQLPGTGLVGPGRKADVKTVAGAQHVAPFQGPRGADMFQPPIERRQRLGNGAFLAPAAGGSGAGDDRHLFAEHGRVLDKNRVGIIFIGRQDGHLQSASAQRLGVGIMLLHGFF